MSTTAHPDDLALARRAMQADARAWEEVLERYGGRIYNLALRFAPTSQEAEDLTQEIFLRLYRNLHQYRGEMPLIAWALRLSRNLCIDHYRAARSRHLSDTVSDVVLDHLPSADDPQARAHAREQLRHVHDALRRLPEALATVLVLADVQQWSYEEIAAFLSVPTGTVKSRLNRARRELAGKLEERLATGRPVLPAVLAIQGVPPC